MTKLRVLIAGVTLAAAGGLAACGDDDQTAGDPGSTAPPASTATPGSTATPDPAFEWPGGPGGPDEGADPRTVVLDVDGALVVTLGGEVYRRGDDSTTGPTGFGAGAAAMAPMPPTPVAWEVAQLTAEGQEQLLAVLDAHGLIGAPPDYGDYMVTDTNPFVMTVRVDGRDRVHELFQPEASVDDDAADAARERLVDFLDVVGDLPDELGDGLGEFETYVPTTWRITFTRPPADVDDLPAWPFSDAPVEGCTDFAADDPTADGADGATGRYTVEGDAELAVVDVVPVMPWQDC